MLLAVAIGRRVPGISLNGCQIPGGLNHLNCDRICFALVYLFQDRMQFHTLLGLVQ